VHLVASAPCPYQMLRYGENVYATQFHPEADTQVFIDRIHIYKDYGYFPPEQADHLIAALEPEHIHMPELILKNFVAKYSIPESPQ
jgi:GMP synthase (glutamine-hydrolysing)